MKVSATVESRRAYSGNRIRKDRMGHVIVLKRAGSDSDDTVWDDEISCDSVDRGRAYFECLIFDCRDRPGNAVDNHRIRNLQVLDLSGCPIVGTIHGESRSHGILLVSENAVIQNIRRVK